MTEDPEFYVNDEVMEQRYLAQLQENPPKGWEVLEPFPSHDPLIRQIREHIHSVREQIASHGRDEGECVCDTSALLPSFLGAVEAILQLHDKVVVDEYTAYDGSREEIVMCVSCGQDMDLGPCQEVEALAAALDIEWDGLL